MDALNGFQIYESFFNYIGLLSAGTVPSPCPLIPSQSYLKQCQLSVLPHNLVTGMC
jgi:hypothetical protein